MYKHLVVPDEVDLFVVGDLHGVFSLYKQAEKELGIKKEDYVISLGDLTDRGDENFKCVMEFTQYPNRHAIMGNHDDMMVKAFCEGSEEWRGCWVQNGGDTVLEEVGVEGAVALATMMQQFPVILTVEHRGKTLAFIHAEYPVELVNIRPQDVDKFQGTSDFPVILEKLVWGRNIINNILAGKQIREVQGVDYIFHGHTPVKKPVMHGNRVYMDTGAVFCGKLTFAYFNSSEELKFYTTQED